MNNKIIEIWHRLSKFINSTGFCQFATHMFCYFFYLLFLILIADIVYTKFFEHIPELKMTVYLQAYESSLHQRSKIEGLFYELRPNSKNKNIKINSLGMRNDEPRLPKDSYRVLAMGDSVAFAPEVDRQERFTEIAEKILNNNGQKIEILNAGVSCYNTKQELIALKEKYLNLNPDLVIFVFCINDTGTTVIQYLPDEYTQKTILDKFPKYSNTMSISNLSVVEYLALVLPSQFILNYNFDRWLLLHSGIYRTISILKFKSQHGVKDLKDLLYFLFSFNFDQVLEGIKKLARERNFLVRFLILPSAINWNRDGITQSFIKNGIIYWDFDSQTKKSLDSNCNLWHMGGPHLNLEGHLTVGRLLAEEIKKLIK